MSLFGSFLGDMDDDGIFGNQMRSMGMQMNQMNRLMTSMMGGGGLMDPFGMMSPFDNNNSVSLMRRNPHQQQLSLIGFPPMMPNLNRLMNTSGNNFCNSGTSFSSSSITTMTSGPDGRPQVYQATSSTKTGPNGIRETRKTVQDSTRGVKKMAIGHHIGERGHIIEKEQDTRSGQMEERQDFINIEEDDAEQFDQEFQTKARGIAGHNNRYNNAITSHPKNRARITDVTTDEYNNRAPRSNLLAITAPPSSSTSIHPHPYNASAARKNFRSKHSKNKHHTVEIVELPNDD